MWISSGIMPSNRGTKEPAEQEDRVELKFRAGQINQGPTRAEQWVKLINASLASWIRDAMQTTTPCRYQT